uniref:Glucose-6-phosphate isomerase n=20 Tax=Euphyllophyta TaxID=78536 RepID=A0A0C9RNU4_9CONI
MDEKNGWWLRNIFICGGVAGAALLAAFFIDRHRSRLPSSRGALRLCKLSQSAAESISMAETKLVSGTNAWQSLKEHVADIQKTHLRDLLKDKARCESMTLEFDGIILDYSRQRATQETLEKLFKLAEVAHLKEKIDRMYNGEHINSTENRAVLHVALRAARDTVINCDGKNVVDDVWKVLDKINEFSERVRSGAWVGATGKPLKDVVSVGIGGSFLGPLFVHTALQTDPEAAQCAKGRQLRFLANVDPVDVARSLYGLNPETTLVVVVSKTFTTAETMLNARTLRTWITSALGPDAVAKHMVAVSTNLKLVKEFGIDPENAFAFWDWVGGRYSVCSAVGVFPLSLQYGFPIVSKFLEGARSIDHHFHTTPFKKNIPVLLGVLSVWNVSFLGYPARAILPYCQALEKFAPHIQQLSMESNGKGVSIDGIPLPFEAGEIDFGEPGTNGQHSFYQLIHQGRVIPCDFIGIIKSQQPVCLKGEVVSNHDELMSNFFAQPDALACGKTPEELKNEKVADNLITHKTFSGNRPSLSILLPSLTAYDIGQLLAIYEHRIAVQGFIWDINSFDQWGVELGKSLASRVRTQLNLSRMQGKPVEGFNHSTMKLMNRYLKEKSPTAESCDILPSSV